MKKDMEELALPGSMPLTELGWQNMQLFRLLNAVEGNYGGYGFMSDGRPIC